MPLCYGGGIRSIEDISEILDAGVEKVAINTYAVENPLFVKTAAEAFGSQSIVISLDVKKNKRGKYDVFTRRGKQPTGLEPADFAIRLQEMGAGEIMLNAIECDGTLKGYDIDLIRSVSSVVSIPIIASGGAGTLSHILDAIKLGGASAVAVGSLFVLHGKHRAVLISYPSPQELGVLGI
jgi:cyclase